MIRLRGIYRGGGCYRNQRPTGDILYDKVATIGRDCCGTNQLTKAHEDLPQIVYLVVKAAGAELPCRVHLGRLSVKVLRRAREGDGIALSVIGPVIYYQQEGLTGVNRETGHHGRLEGVI